MVEPHPDESATWIQAAPLTAIAPGTAVAIDVSGRRVLLCNVEGEIYALDDVCTHDGQPLDAAVLDGCLIECPRHGARFDVRDGSVRALPATRPLPGYPVRVADGAIEVALPPPEADDDDPLGF